MKNWAVASVPIAVSIFLAAQAWAEATGGKAIFYSGEGPTVAVKSKVTKPPPMAKFKPKSGKYMGIAYWVKLIGNEGQEQQVTAERIFRSGERIRVHLKSNRDGYLYVINIGSTGRSQLLFPHQAVAGGSNFIKAHIHYEIPHGAYFRFDENPGEEILLVMLAPSPLPALASPPDPQTRTLPKAETDHLVRTAQLRGAKDLILEVDTTSPQPASYVVAPLSRLESGGEMISLQIKLRHK